MAASTAGAVYLDLELYICLWMLAIPLDLIIDAAHLSRGSESCCLGDLAAVVLNLRCPEWGWNNPFNPFRKRTQNVINAMIPCSSGAAAT